MKWNITIQKIHSHPRCQKHILYNKGCAAGVFTDAGVFSKDKVDYGSETMIGPCLHCQEIFWIWAVVME